MSAPTAADLAAAHRWVRDRTVEELFVHPTTGPDSSPMGRRGVIAGPLLAAGLAAVLVWQEPLRRGWAALLGG